MQSTCSAGETSIYTRERDREETQIQSINHTYRRTLLSIPLLSVKTYFRF